MRIQHRTCLLACTLSLVLIVGACSKSPYPPVTICGFTGEQRDVEAEPIKVDLPIQLTPEVPAYDPPVDSRVSWSGDGEGQAFDRMGGFANESCFTGSIVSQGGSAQIDLPLGTDWFIARPEIVEIEYLAGEPDGALVLAASHYWPWDDLPATLLAATPEQDPELTYEGVQLDLFVLKQADGTPTGNVSLQVDANDGETKWPSTILFATIGPVEDAEE